MDLERLKSDLIRDEGVRLKPYLDTVGKMTIGAGRNLTDVGISTDEVDVLLSNDIARTLADLDRELPWWRNLDPVRARAIANMAFNIGIGNDAHGLLSFHHTLICLESGQWSAAAEGMRASLWHRQVGPRALRIEAMIESGVDT